MAMRSSEGGHIRRQAEEDRDAAREHRQCKPDPQHHRRARNVERPWMRGRENEIQQPAAERYRGEHRRERQPSLWLLAG